MKQIFKILLLSIITIVSAYGQDNNLVKYTPEYQFKEGIYVDFESFKTNNPITISTIVTNIPLNDIDFFNKLLKKEKISFYDNNGIKQSIEPKHLWGYSKHNTAYINYNGNFYRLPTIGKISQFIASVTVVRTTSDPFYGGGYYGGVGPTTTYEDKETKHFLLSLENGTVYENNYKNVEKLLLSDKQIYDEYMALKKRKRKQLSYMFIKKFNDANPVYFP